MRGSKRSPGLLGLGVLLAAVVVYAGPARADISTDQAGSLIIFPKVISDGSRDTLIQIANTSNSIVNAQCFYVNAAGACSVTPGLTCDVDADCPVLLPTNPPKREACVHVCREIDFFISLTPQQPTIWTVSLGRNPGGTDGFFLTQVPPVERPFVGELKCVQVDRNGQPTNTNALKGEAILFGIPPGEAMPNTDLSEYNAIAILANSAGANTLVLDAAYRCGGGTNNGLLCTPPDSLDFCGAGSCLATGGFNPCPQQLIVPHYADGATDSFSGATVTSELSLVSCTELFEAQTATFSNAQINTWDEFETRISASVQFGCYLNRTLADFFGNPFGLASGGQFRKTRIRPQAGFQCYSGDKRCHMCGVFGSSDPALAETDAQCFGVAPNTVVGNCSCNPATQAASCPNAVSIGFCSNSGTTKCASADDCPGGVAGGAACNLTTLGCMQSPGLLGLIEEFYTPVPPVLDPAATAARNIYTEGDRPGDVIVLPGQP